MQDIRCKPPYRDGRASCVRAGSRKIGPLVALCLLFLPEQVLAAAQANPHRSLYGEVGLLDLPNARMAKDGELSFSFGAMKNVERYNLAVQIVPWLDASFRYTHIAGYINSTGAFKNYYDRSFSLKMRLMEESNYFPEVSVGIRDIVGTGVYGAEYLTASKRFGDIDATLGIGWGRLAGKPAFGNPLTIFSSAFETRDEILTTGQLSVGELFNGPDVGVFFGLEYQTPIEGLSAMLEYSSDVYKSERLAGSFKVSNPVNMGLAYRLYDNVQLTAGWMYGTTWSAGLVFTADPTDDGEDRRIGPTLPPPVSRDYRDQQRALSGLLDNRSDLSLLRSGGPWVTLTSEQKADGDLRASLMLAGGGIQDMEVSNGTLVIVARFNNTADAQCRAYAKLARTDDRVSSIAVTNDDGDAAICPVFRSASSRMAGPRPSGIGLLPNDIERRIRAGAAEQDLIIDGVLPTTNEVWVYYRNGRYFSEARAAGRLGRVLMTVLPAEVEIFHLVLIKTGVPVREFRLTRTALERIAATNGTAIEQGEAISLTMPPVPPPQYEQSVAASYPRFSWSLSPGLRESLFDPASPLQVQLLAVGTAGVELMPGLNLSMTAGANIYNNLSSANVSTSVLPHVRSDIAEYYLTSPVGITDLQVSYGQRVSPHVFAEVRAGLLEDMFAGVGGQVLWRPDGDRFAIGADLYQVWQRGFTRMFDFRNYNVLTGHISFYYESPWHDIDLALHVGRYLAGDYGATIEVTRRFESGVIIGAFATFTDVPFDTFGEGSFDKGILIKIPLEWPLPFYTQSNYGMELHSLTRDGGQRLVHDDSLYDDTRSSSYSTLSHRLEDLANP